MFSRYFFLFFFVLRQNMAFRDVLSTCLCGGYDAGANKKNSANRLFRQQIGAETLSIFLCRTALTFRAKLEATETV